jgi:hypothetical protein
MPLPPPVERKHLHTRIFRFSGYRRDDGLWDIDGHMTDNKTYGFKNEFRGEIGPDEPLHDMWIRLTLDDDFLVHDIEAATEAAPYQVCPQITPNFKAVVGLRVGQGWRQKIRERLGGVEGCTHLVELLGAMATVAFQTIYPTLAKKATERASTQKPGLIDSCHAFRGDGDVVKKTWPDFYTGS